MKQKDNLYNRELSWLSFNHRVLQEAEDQSVPLYERLKFLAIFSSNLDEFFRVRVASLRNLLNLKGKSTKELKFDPVELLEKIYGKVNDMQENIGRIFKKQIIPELRSNNIFLVNEKQLQPKHKQYLKEYFNEMVLPQINPMILVKNKIIPFLRNNRLYLVVRLTSHTAISKKHKKSIYSIVEIPSNHLPRFIELPAIEDRHYYIFLDDVIRFGLPLIFHGYDILEAYSVKLTRDAELYIDDEFAGNLLQKIIKGIKKRTTGVPCRFLFDSDMPKPFIKFLKEAVELTNEDLLPGGRYHNFSDFMSFPNPGNKKLVYRSMPALNHSEYDKYKDKFEAWKAKDYLLYYPYNSYDYVVNAFKIAANDPQVRSIKITQYRVAQNSQIVKNLIRAKKNGKDVTAFVEIKARFDEEVNIQSAEDMQKAGIKVIYSMPGLKVHAKIAHISREENGELVDYAYLSTGNFNERTGKLYSDYGLFTADKRIASEVRNVFEFLEDNSRQFEFRHLLVAQFNMRQTFTSLIDNEIANAKKGKRAELFLKMNSIEDEKMIKKLYEASQAGVKIRMIVRAINCLIPGLENRSENIEIVSIVDRFLEHSRVYVFHNDGNEIMYLASADWMKRNLNRRIETAFPIYDEKIKKMIKDHLEIQWMDNVKARIIDKEQLNHYRLHRMNENFYRAQYDLYDYIKENVSKLITEEEDLGLKIVK